MTSAKEEFMFGKGVFQEEENLLRDIIRSIDKKVDYTAKEGQGSRFTVHVKLRSHEADVMLDIEDLKAARTDMVRRHQIRQKLKARCDHLDMSRYAHDILGLKPARLLRTSPKPEFTPQRSGFGRGPRR
jgi:hypothetical protein